MQFLQAINSVRRRVMARLTRRLGVTRIHADVDLLSQGNVRRILICRPNHRLGNLLMVTPLLQEVIATFPQASIDLFTKGHIAPVLFAKYPNINRFIQLPKRPAKHLLAYLGGWITIRRNRYDLVVNVVNHSSSGKIAAWFANAKFRFLGDITADIRLAHPDHVHTAKTPVYSFRHFIHMGARYEGRSPVPTLDLKTDAHEREEGGKALRRLSKNEKPVICLYTYATGVKRYSPEWWKDFYRRLKVHFPGYNIIELLPVENVSQIDFAAPSFYSKDLRIIGGFIAGAAVFIGADSGMMHLASATHTPTVGLFKVTDPNAYAPYGDRSIGIATEKVGIDEVLTIIAQHVLMR